MQPVRMPAQVAMGQTDWKKSAGYVAAAVLGIAAIAWFAHHATSSSEDTEYDEGEDDVDTEEEQEEAQVEAPRKPAPKLTQKKPATVIARPTAKPAVKATPVAAPKAPTQKAPLSGVKQLIAARKAG